MKIMLDTNVLVSLLLFPNPQINEMIENIFAEHQLVKIFWGSTIINIKPLNER